MRSKLSALSIALATVFAGVAVAATPAAAALPDAHGFVLWNGARRPGGHLSRRRPRSPAAAGSYTDQVPRPGGNGRRRARDGDQLGPRWCQAEAGAPSGADEIVISAAQGRRRARHRRVQRHLHQQLRPRRDPGVVRLRRHSAPTGSDDRQYNSAGAGNRRHAARHAASGGQVPRPAAPPGRSTAACRSPPSPTGPPAARCRNWTSSPGGQVAYVIASTRPARSSTAGSP